MKWILVGIAAVVAVVALVALVGALLPRRHSASVTARYRQPPEAVWTAITAFRDFPAWRSGVQEVRELAGRKGWVERSRQGEMPLAVIAEEPPARLVLEIADPGLPFGGTWTYRIEPDEGGSRLTITEDGEIKNTIFRFMARFVFGYHATMEGYLTDLGQRFGESVAPQRLAAAGER